MSASLFAAKKKPSATPPPPLPKKEAKKSGLVEFGKDVATEVDKIIRKNDFTLWGDPWSFQGIPLVFYSRGNGFHLGFKANIQNIRRKDPHTFELQAQALASDRGRNKHYFLLDFPHAFDDRFQVTARFAYDREVSFRYYGIGNETVQDPAALDRGDYDTIQASPSIQIETLYRLGKNFRMGPLVGLRWVSVTNPPGSLLDRERPTGFLGGKSHFLGLGAVFETLDFAPYPTRGLSHELYQYLYQPFTNSDFNFYRANYTFRYFLPLRSNLILATRHMVEYLTGNVPIFELTSVGGAWPSLSFSGSRFLRGFDSNRFIDRVRYMAGIELRWDPFQFQLFRNDVYFGIVPFVDYGRVWHDPFKEKFFKFHASWGGGLRLNWDRRFIIRTDVAFNGEGTSFVAELGSTF